MTFFRKPPPTPPAPPPQPPTTVRPFQPSTKGDRIVNTRRVQEEVNTARPTQTREDRKRNGNGRRGLTNEVLDRMPSRVLLYVKDAQGRKIGYFDDQGYWCVPKQDKMVEVRRGSPKAVLRLLGPDQRAELERVRQKARRNGLR